MLDIRVLASGYGTIEGPTVEGDSLYFSDVSRGGVYKLLSEGQVDTVIPKRKGVGGICLHRNGGLIVSGRDVSHVVEGKTRVLLSREQAQLLPGAGRRGRVGGFNDLLALPDGRILVGTVRLDENDERLKGELLLVSGEGQAVVLYGNVGDANGIAIDEQGNIFHAASTDRQIIVSRFSSTTQVKIIHRISTADILGVPDGLAIDEAGCCWVAFYKGSCVAQFDPSGKLLQTINMPAHEVTSVCFSGRDLIVVTEDNTADPTLEGCVFVIKLEVSGAPVGAASL